MKWLQNTSYKHSLRLRQKQSLAKLDLVTLTNVIKTSPSGEF